MKRDMKILNLAVGCALVGLGMSAAQAAPIASFAFATSGGFLDNTNASCSNGGATACNLTFGGGLSDGGNLEVSWGTPSTASGNNLGGVGEQSMLRITHDPLGLGSIPTNGGFVTVDQFEHINHIITAAGGYMDAVDLLSRFVLLPPPVNPLNPPGLFDTQLVTFLESLNQQNCPAPNPNGTFCDDEWNVEPLQGAFDFLVQDGYKYRIEFQFAAGPGAAVIEQDDGTFDIWTSEPCSDFNPEACGPYAAGRSTVFIQAQITATEVPEPGVLFLLGIGLAGLGAVSRYSGRASNQSVAV